MKFLLNKWKHLPPSLILLGFVSFLNDFSSEMIYPLLPLFLTQQLGASPAIIGLIEGAAESTASLLKYFSGALSDHFKHKKPLIILGYSISSFVRPFMALAMSWHWIFTLRFLDRVGKGIRTAPRDVLIAEITAPEHRGQAYGFHRSMDHIGAVIGPLVASALLSLAFIKMELIFIIAFIPSLFSLYILQTKVVESPYSEQTKERPTENTTEAPRKRVLNPWKALLIWNHIPPKVQKIIFVFFVFALANSSDAFFLLRLKEVGLPTYSIPLIWAILHIVKMVSNYKLGHLSDRLGYKNMILIGWIFYSLIYLGFAYFQNYSVLILLFLAYGIHFGMVEGPERAWISVLCPDNMKGTALGLYHMSTGIAILPASWAFGYLWTHWGYSSAFIASSALSFLAVIFLLFLGKDIQ